MQIAILSICAIPLLVAFLYGFKATFYRWRMMTLIQLDRRYSEDITWKKEADRAIFNFREAEFAIKYGVVQEHPRWVRKWKVMFFGGILLSLMLVVIAALVMGPPRR